jgi:hypothetical protein
VRDEEAQQVLVISLGVDGVLIVLERSLLLLWRRHSELILTLYRSFTFQCELARGLFQCPMLVFRCDARKRLPDATHCQPRQRRSEQRAPSVGLVVVQVPVRTIDLHSRRAVCSNDPR